MEVPCDKPFPEEQARLYLRDIVLGLEYCEWRTGPFLSVYTNLPISFSGGVARACGWGQGLHKGM